MRKTLVIPTAAAIAFGGLAVVAPSAQAGGWWSKAKAERQIKKAGVKPVGIRKVRKYHLNKNELRQIKKAKKWARGSKPRSVRQCESGGNYRINTGNGYYGAYQFAYGTWRGIGGQRFAPTANRAPKFAQDYMAYKLYQSAGWGPWSCA